MHLRNAPTQLMRGLGYGHDYRYDHDYPDAIAPGQAYLPQALRGQDFYQPSERGLEARIRERLLWIRAHRQSPNESKTHA